MSRLLRVPVLILALVAVAGCSGSDQAGSEGGAAETERIPPRPIPEVWADVLKERDRIHAAIAKEEMWHEDCAEVAAGALELGKYLTEFVQSAQRVPTIEPGRHLAISEVVNVLAGVLSRLRESGIQEAPGAMPALMPPLDRTLRGLENYLKPEELGSDSVVTHPGFNPNSNPPPPSPV